MATTNNQGQTRIRKATGEMWGDLGGLYDDLPYKDKGACVVAGASLLFAEKPQVYLRAIRFVRDLRHHGLAEYLDPHTVRAVADGKITTLEGLAEIEKKKAGSRLKKKK